MSKYLLSILVITHTILYICLYLFYNGKENIQSLALVNSLNIGIIAVVNTNGQKNYSYAIDTVKCYSKIHGYTFLLVENLKTNKCNHSDHFFRRHCHVVNTLKRFDYLLSIDADIGVVNPERKLEEFIDPKFDITFYDRFYNYEIATGSYIVKNTEWTRKFLHDFVNYQYRLPKSFHGTDNGAIHAYIAETLLPDRKVELNNCLHIYGKSQNYTDLYVYEICIRNMLGLGTDFGHIKISKKGTGWVRDNWITNSLWNDSIDFMLHSWKDSRLKHYLHTDLPINIKRKNTFEWYNPLAGPVDLSKCHAGNLTWKYDPNLKASREDIEKELQAYYEEIEKQKIKLMARMNGYFFN